MTGQNDERRSGSVTGYKDHSRKIRYQPRRALITTIEQRYRNQRHTTVIDITTDPPKKARYRHEKDSPNNSQDTQALSNLPDVPVAHNLQTFRTPGNCDGLTLSSQRLEGIVRSEQET